ncbi:hypothetical protein BGZ76_007541 [Entomortierella beljakovae]|nr:hypothetical protein BGZ76_007541 [Entomortierella beljakovae]
MCGRTVQGLAPDQIRKQLSTTLPSEPSDSWIGEDKYRASYNVAPTRYQPVVRADPGTHSYVVHMMRWGLIPRNTKAMPDYNSVLKSINARDDSLFMGPTGKAIFSHSKNNKRCILLAEGFYEWRRRGKERVPFYTKRVDGKLMLMAAIYDVAHIQGSEEPLYTYATITTNASPQLDWLHDRMPVLIPNGDHEKIRLWLDPKVSWNSTLEAMLKPCDEFLEGDGQCSNETSTTSKKVYALETYQVDEKVNSVKNDSPNFAQPWNTSSNKKTLNRFFVSKSLKQEDAGNSTTPQDDTMESIDVHSQDLSKDTDVQSNLITSSANAESTKYHNSEDTQTTPATKKEQVEMNPILERSLEESRKVHDRESDEPYNSDDFEHEPKFDIQVTKSEVDSAVFTGSVDLLQKRRDEIQREEEEMKKVLEMSLLQAIADGHEGSISQNSQQIQEKEQVDMISKKEQDDLERAIAASLSESGSHSQQSSLSSKEEISFDSKHRVTPSATTTPNTTPKKRKLSISPSSPGGKGAKSRKPAQDTKITSFFLQKS